jgi:1-deoxy-D-xylulose 5-phosphate reductoisomerase
VLDAYDGAAPDTVDDVIAADAEARQRATAYIKETARR